MALRIAAPGRRVAWWTRQDVSVDCSVRILDSTQARIYVHTDHITIQPDQTVRRARAKHT